MCNFCEENSEEAINEAIESRRKIINDILKKLKDAKDTISEREATAYFPPNEPGHNRSTYGSWVPPKPYTAKPYTAKRGWLDYPEFENETVSLDAADFRSSVRDKSEEAINLLLKKHDDYGPNNIAMSPGGPLNGLTVRLWDKVARLAHLLETGVSPQNESVYDTLVDISNYGLIGMMVVDGLWPDPELGDK